MTKPTATIRVILTTRDAEDNLLFTTIGQFPTRAKAFAAAKRAAGRGATFSRRGITLEYVGPKGTAWIGVDAQ